MFPKTRKRLHFISLSLSLLHNRMHCLRKKRDLISIFVSSFSQFSKAFFLQCDGKKISFFRFFHFLSRIIFRFSSFFFFFPSVDLSYNTENAFFLSRNMRLDFIQHENHIFFLLRAPTFCAKIDEFRWNFRVFTVGFFSELSMATFLMDFRGHFHYFRSLPFLDRSLFTAHRFKTKWRI